jgi:regulator of cell morphogenesis and NO signaling
MMKEEEILFPYIRSLIEAERTGRRIPPSPFGTVYNPIRMMEAEHQGTGGEMRLIRELTRDYALPDYACATYRVCFEELREFERDLHLHVHLENNVLFPRAIRLEAQLS